MRERERREENREKGRERERNGVTGWGYI